MQRTYSRKRNLRRSYPLDLEVPQDEPPADAGQSRARKRQKIEVEVISPHHPSTSMQPCEDEDEAEDTRHEPGYRSGTPQLALFAHRRTSTPPLTPPKTVTTSATEDHNSVSSRRPVRGLSSVTSYASSQHTLPSVVKPQRSIARRMLGRTRTESSVISISSSSEQGSLPVHGTPKKLRPFLSDSVVGSPSSHSPSHTPSKARPSDDVSSPSLRPVPVGPSNNVRTYAGKSRSFLVALPPSQAVSIGMGSTLDEDTSAVLLDNSEDDFDIRESYSELRQRWGVDGSEDDPRPVSPHASPSPKRKGKGKGVQKELEPAKLFPNGMINDLKSITELRSKGERRRFLDEVGYLFEGLDSTGALGVRRGSAMEVVSKLSDVEFSRRAKAADFLGRAWEVLREAGGGTGDRVLDPILSFYAALVARDSTDLLDLIAKPDFASTLHRMLASLEHQTDPLWLISCGAGIGVLKAAGISKTEATMLGNLHRLVRKKAGIFDECDIISSRLLISYALTVVPPSTHTLSHLPPLLRSLTSEISLIPSRVTAYISGLSLFPPASPSSYLDTPSHLHLDHCLRLLDSCLLGSWSISEEELTSQAERLEKLREEGFPRAIVALCVSCCIILQDPVLAEHRGTASKCVESALRVLINLTHDDIGWCRAVLDDDLSIPAIMRLVVIAQRQRSMLEKRLNADEVADEDADDAARCLDRLCLALGLLTNLVQATPDASHIVGDTLLDFNCTGQRRCLRECTCPSRNSSLGCLAQVYTHYLKSSDELDAVVRGHMAVLFGLFMQHSSNTQRNLLAALPGGDDRAKLAMLIQHAQDFTSFYVALTRKMAEARLRGQDSEEEPEEDCTTTVPGTGAVFRDSKGEVVAKGVVTFLQTLRTTGMR